jgi:hypothetical protein
MAAAAFSGGSYVPAAHQRGRLKAGLDHAGLMLDLSELLGRKVDLVSKNGLKPFIRDSVLGGARRLYALYPAFAAKAASQKIAPELG